jgi:hypothetical protein
LVGLYPIEHESFEGYYFLAYENYTEKENNIRQLDFGGSQKPGCRPGQTGHQHAPGGISGASANFNFYHGRKAHMNKRNSPVDRIKIGLAIAVLSSLTGGCVGYVDGGYGGGVVVAPAPDVFLFGGGYDRGHDVRGYSQRGSESRAAAHPGGGGGGRR